MMGFKYDGHQDGNNPQGFQILFSWAKEDIKI